MAFPAGLAAGSLCALWIRQLTPEIHQPSGERGLSSKTSGRIDTASAFNVSGQAAETEEPETALAAEAAGPSADRQAADTQLVESQERPAAQPSAAEERTGDVPPRSSRALMATVMLGSACLFSLLAVALLDYGCQQTPAVRPAEFWRTGRVVYQLLLLALLITATGTDLRDYVIPDEITLPGTFIGLTGAFVAGDLQIIHLWIDWNAEIPGLQGPWIPEWIVQHPHLHGLAWSLCGALAGAGLTWLLRFLSRLLLGQESMGFGDVTLMAMVGSFVGWQPVVVILLLAPLCGLVFALLGPLLSGRPYLPYGPYLASATVLTLLSWRWIWMFELPTGGREPFAVRRLFGDPLLLGGTAVAAATALCVLLGLWRLYRLIPAGNR
ncbi:MAG: prepilin peptidase [Planctomycetaceae bacterium]|nr:prepilin peptidase [Planctomycetaceae bacterium]